MPASRAEIATIERRKFTGSHPFVEVVARCGRLSKKEQLELQGRLSRRMYHQLKRHPQTLKRCTPEEAGVLAYLIELDISKKDRALFKRELKRNPENHLRNWSSWGVKTRDVTRLAKCR